MSRFLIVNFWGMNDAREEGRELRIVETPLSAVRSETNGGGASRFQSPTIASVPLPPLLAGLSEQSRSVKDGMASGFFAIGLVCPAGLAGLASPLNTDLTGQHDSSRRLGDPADCSTRSTGTTPRHGGFPRGSEILEQPDARLSPHASSGSSVCWMCLAFPSLSSRWDHTTSRPHATHYRTRGWSANQTYGVYYRSPRLLSAPPWPPLLSSPLQHDRSLR